MASNDYNPTAANILSSLRVKGATIEGGSGKAGFVPVLGADGKLDPSVISTDGISSQVSISPLDDTAYVVYGRNTSSYTPNGSIASPFSSITDASTAGFSNFIVESGSFGDTHVTLSMERAGTVRISSTGSTTFNLLSITGYKPGSNIILDNISVTTSLGLSSSSSCDLYLTGFGSSGSVHGTTEDPDDPESDKYVKHVYLSPDYAVGSFVNAEYVGFLASSERIASSSQSVPGTTVKDAIDGLGSRKLRIPSFSTGTSGLQSSTEDIVVALGDYGYYDLTSVGSTLVQSVNATFHKDGDSPSYAAVTADSLSSTSLYATSAKMTSLSFGTKSTVSATVKVTDGFLSID